MTFANQSIQFGSLFLDGTSGALALTSNTDYGWDLWTDSGSGATFLSPTGNHGVAVDWNSLAVSTIWLSQSSTQNTWYQPAQTAIGSNFTPQMFLSGITGIVTMLQPNGSGGVEMGPCIPAIFSLVAPVPLPPPTAGPLHFGMFGQSTAADYAATEQQFGMSSGSMWLSGPGLAYDSWSNYTGSAFSAAQLAMQQGRSKIFINFPPIVNGATLTQAAAGDFNTYYSQAAGQFNNSAFDTVVFRCIWEWQGGWYPWGWSSGQQNQSTYVTDFIGAFQQMVTTIRSNMGNVKNVQFCLSGAQGDQVQMPNWQACYPGDAYVDWIGVDWYDGNPQDNTGTTLADEQARWAQDNAPGASTCFQLCTEHQKGFAIPEWSVGKCGDDPYFVDQVRATLQAVQNAGLPVFAGYWRAPYGGVNGDYNLYPNTLARMLADFPGSQSS